MRGPASMLLLAVLSSGTPRLWVSATEAFDAEGNLRPDRIAEARQSIIERNRRANPGPDCRLFIGSVSETFRPTNTLDELVANALTIVAGEVTHAEAGFYRGDAGTLLTIDVAEQLKTFGRTGIRDRAYLFVQEGRSTTPTGLVCSSTFSAVPLPRAGDRIIAFAYFEPIDEEGVILPIEMRHQLFVERGERLYAPAGAKSAIATLRDLADAIRAHPLLHAAVGREQ